MHFQRNVQRVTDRPALVPAERKMEARSNLMQLIHAATLDAFFILCEYIVDNFPRLEAFLHWYCEKGPRTMIFEAFRVLLRDGSPEDDRPRVPLSTNQVEGRNSALKARLNSDCLYDKAILFFVENLIANKTMESASRSKSDVVIGCGSGLIIVRRWI